MSGLYHINGDSVSPCRAKQGGCPFGQGEENNHFEDPREAMAVLEKRLSNEYQPLTGMTKETTSKHTSAKDLAEGGASPKEIRDALRLENPDWPTNRVHTVAQKMISKQTERTNSAVTPIVTLEAAKELQANYKSAEEKLERITNNLSRLYAEKREHNKNFGSDRAFHYGVNGKTQGVNPDPDGSTFYEKAYWQEERIKAGIQVQKDAVKQVEDAQTALEEAGLGHTIPDEGNTIRVRTQAQKWLLKNELLGQISDGHWENSGPHNHWSDWSGAKVIVDPQNPGRNFNPIKDNYQLNSRGLLGVVGDRMVYEVKSETGKDYDEKAMQEDLKDLRKIFKTSRPNLG
jgi:hypothetical protein